VTGRREGDLDVTEERVLIEVPRDRDGRVVLRMRFVRASTSSGSKVAWHDLREYFRGDDGQLHPTRKGISIRGKELHAVAVAMLRACAASVPPELHGAAKAIVAALVAKGAAPASVERPARAVVALRTPSRRRTEAPAEPLAALEPDPPDLF
jgi:Transcriptional Coactivator p15 (PC4)